MIMCILYLQEEFKLAMFNNSQQQNLFADRVLYTFAFLIYIITFFFYVIHFVRSIVLIRKFLNVQIFTLFDVKQKGKIYFADFVKALHVFHPDTSIEEKIDCNIRVNIVNG